MDWLQTLLLALIQGLTEFLPISSSAHLLLPNILFGWQDQGLALDVALHLGTLFAVVVYLRRDLRSMATGLGQCLHGGGINTEVRLIWILVLASLPLLPAGLLIAPRVDMLRTASVIATTTIVFGLLLWWADRRRGDRSMQQLQWYEALFIGLAQACALLPGTSRSGVTMTAALVLGLNRVEAARFSFLMAIPAIGASGLHQTVELLQADQPAPWLQLLVAAVLAALVAMLAMHGLLAWLRRAGMMPFVIYRLVLGALLFSLFVF